MGVVSPRSSLAQRDGPRPGRHAPPPRRGCHSWGQHLFGRGQGWCSNPTMPPRDEGTSPPVSAAPPRGPGLCQTWFQQPRPCRWPRACHTPWPDLSLPVCKAGGRPLAFETRVPSQAVRTGRPPLLLLLAREGLLWNTANTQQPWCPRYPPLLPGLSWGRQPAPRAGGSQAGRLRVSSASRLRQRETGCHLPASGAEIPGRAPREGVPVGRRPPSRTSPVRPAAAAVPACARARVCVRVQARVRSRVRMRV